MPRDADPPDQKTNAAIPASRHQYRATKASEPFGASPRISSRALRALVAVAISAFNLPATAYDLAQHEWRHRLIVIAAPSADDPLAREQRRMTERRRAALDDRDLRVFELYGDVGYVDGRPLSTQDRARLRGHFRIDEGTRELLLVGKDGGVKRRAALDTDLRELFVQIDEMPMRRSEMRGKRAAGLPVTEP